MKEYKFNLKENAPQVQKQWNDLFLGKLLGGKRLEPDTFKLVSSIFFNIVSHKDLMNELTELSTAYHNAYREFLGQPRAEEESTTKLPFIKEQTEEEVRHNQWRRFVSYTTESAKRNGKLKQSDNAKAYMWLKNNELLGFNCGTDLKTLPKKYKELIVYAAKHKFEGISMKLNPQTCKYNISLDYLDFVCASLEPLF